MAYADALRQAVFSTETCADLIDGLIHSGFEATTYTTAGGSAKTNTGTWADIGDLESEITITATDIIFVFAYVSISSSAIGLNAQIRAVRDGDTITGLNPIGNTMVASTLGESQPLVLMSYNWGTAGTYTYNIQWRLIGSGTIYSRYGNMIIFKGGSK